MYDKPTIYLQKYARNGRGHNTNTIQQNIAYISGSLIERAIANA